MKKRRTITDHELSLLKPLFWDLDPSMLDLQKNKFPIIERIMIYGRHESLNWMTDVYKEKDFIDIVKRSRNIDKKTANYWAIRLNIPREEIICLKRQLLQSSFY